MKVWEKYCSPFNEIGGEPITMDIVLKSFQKSDIKACQLQGIFHYLHSIKCNGDCLGHMRIYLSSEVGENEADYEEVTDENGDKQLRMW